MKQKIVILGAGTFQRGLVLFLKQQGFVVLCITNKPNEISAQDASILHDISYTDHKKVLDIYKSEKAIQIFSVGSDAALPTQSIVQEYFSLSGNTIEKAHFFADKWNYKKVLNTADLSPKTFAIENFKQLKNILKNRQKTFMLKPISGGGSNGVCKVDKTSSLFEISNLISKERYLLEEFIEGEEFGCNLFIYKGNIHYAAITKKSFNTWFVPESHLILSTSKKNIWIPFIKQVKKELSLNDGFYNMDVITTHNTPYLIDISPRLGGNCMSEIIHIGYQINEYDYLKKWLLNEPIAYVNIEFKNNVGVYIINSKEKGILQNKVIKNHPFRAFEIELFWNKKIGDTIEVFNKGSHHLGYFIFKASTDHQLTELLQKIKNYKWFTLEKN